VTVGYPETLGTQDSTTNLPPINYNSTVTVSPAGQVVANYRKRFLYYTDETWAAEGDGPTPSGFYSGSLEGLGPVTLGICMDINPYKFVAPWTAYEFSKHVLQNNSQLVVLSMAWLTRLTAQEMSELPLRPDNETFSYWIERFFPLQRATGPPIFVVMANRCGAEGPACYAGTSSVICFRDGRGYIYDILGKWDEQCMVVDLQKVSFPNLRMVPI
jgi:protein N-terminal amidase